MASSLALLGKVRRLQKLREELRSRATSAVSRCDEPFEEWCRNAVIRTKRGGKVYFAPEVWHEEQRRYWEHRTKRDIILKPRQIGQSTFCLAEDLHYALSNEGVSVLVVSHTDVEQLFMTIRIMADHLRADGKLPKARRDNVRELSFHELGSSIRVVEAGKTASVASGRGRSGTIHRLHCTEMAFWGSAHETMNALEAAAESADSVVIESTANGAGGLFYDMVKAAEGGRSEYKLHFFPWYLHQSYRREPPPGFDPAARDQHEEVLRLAGCDDEQIAWWRAKVDSPAIGLDKALQEYPLDPESCFRVSGRSYIDPTVIDRLTTSVRPPIRRMDLVWHGRRFGELLIWEDPAPGEEYIIAGDVAEGIGQDASSLTCGNKRTGKIAATFWSDSIAPGDLGLAMAAAGYVYNTAELAPERQNHGAATLRAIEAEAHYPSHRIYKADDRKLGWSTTSATRPVLWDGLRQAVTDGAAVNPDARAVAEAKTLIIDADGKPRARGKGQPDGCKDDHWVSWAIFHQVRTTAREPLQSFRTKWT